MSRILMAGLACAAALCGCVAGIEASGKYPERTFAVAAAPSAVFLRAAVYARTCHEQSQRAVGVTFVAERHPDAKSLGGEVKVRRDDLPGKYFEIIAVRHDGKGDSLVTVTVLGEKEWDEAELDAAERSIATATPVCRQVAR